MLRQSIAQAEKALRLGGKCGFLEPSCVLLPQKADSRRGPAQTLEKKSMTLGQFMNIINPLKGATKLQTPGILEFFP